MYIEGIKSEELIMDLTKKHFGGNVEKSTKEEDIKLHVDFWWISEEGERYGIDVKGKRKEKRSDTNVSSKINWIEIQNVNGKEGWIYGKSSYIVFIVDDYALYVPRKKLVDLVENKVKNKQILKEMPSETYVPYQRKDRKDIIVKIPNDDLIKISKHIIKIES